MPLTLKQQQQINASYGAQQQAPKPPVSGAPTPQVQGGKPPSQQVSPTAPEGEWDYKTSPIDPQGNLLPEGAQGWTPHGTPYFGQGIGGTLKKYAWMLTGDNPNKLVDKFNTFTHTEGEANIKASGRVLLDELKQQGLRFLSPNDPTKQGDWQKLSELNAGIKAADDKNVATSAAELEAQKAYNAQLWKNLEGTSALSPVIKTVKVGLNVITDVFSEAAVKFEQAQSANLAVGDYLEEQGIASTQLDDSANVADEKLRGRNRAINILSNLALPILQAIDSFKFVLAPGTFEEKKQAIQTGWDAGKMLYSQTLNPAILEEFKRRAAAGEDPQLLAMELQNPWAEAVGQIVLDPLNVIGFAMKSAKIADVMNDASKATRTAEEMASIADDLADLAKTPVGEARAVDKMNKVDDGLQAAITASDKRVTLQYGGGTDFSPSGYRVHWGKKVKSTTMLFTQAVMRNGGSTDDLADLAHHGAMLRSADKATRLEALDGYMELANKYKLGRTAFSEMALDTWNLVGRMTEGKGGNIIKLLESARGDPAKFAEVATKLMDDTVAYAAPDYGDLKKAALAVTQGAPTARDAELAGKLADVSPVAKKLLEANAGKVGEFKRKANDILSQFYFGTYGPGARNAMGNATHMIVDRGAKGTVSAFFRDGKYWSLDAIETEMKAYFGGQLPPDLLGLSLVKSSGGDVEKVLGVIPAPKGKILGVLPTPGKFMDDTEKAFATRIYWSNFRDTMDKVLSPGVALPDRATFKAMGLSEAQIKHFTHIVKTETFGDVEKAIIKYGEKYGESGLDAWRDWQAFADPNQMKGLRAVGMEQEINAISEMKDATPQKIRDEFARLRRSVEARAAEATGDAKAVSSSREEFSFLNDFGKAVDQGHLDGDGLGQLNERLETAAGAQDEAMSALGRARDKYNQLVGAGAAAPLDFGIVEQVGSEARKLAVRNKTGGITQTAWDVTKKIKKGLPRAEMQKLWDASIMSGTPLPAAQEEIHSQLWQGTRFSVSQAWETHFAENFSQLIPLMENLKVADPSIAQLFQKADKASMEAQQMRSAIFHNNRIYVQPPAQSISEVASRYKIPTATQGGAPQWDQLANTLKKAGMDISPEDLRAGNGDPELMRMVEDTLKQRGDEAADVAKATDKEVGDYFAQTEKESKTRRAHWDKWISENIREGEIFTPPNDSGVRLKIKDGDVLQSRKGENWHSPKAADLDDWSGYKADEAAKGATQAGSFEFKSASWTPSAERVSSEAGGALRTSPTEKLPGSQPLAPQTSTLALEPSATSRTTAPSTTAGPATTLIGDIDKTSNRIVLQSANDVQENLRRAEAALPKLQALGDEMASTIEGTKFVGARVKEMPRLTDKLRTRAANTISDYLGSRLTFDDTGDAEKIVKALEEKGYLVTQENFMTNPRNGGYRAIHLQVDMGDGFTAEMQLVPDAIAKVQNEAHKAYDVFRDSTASLEAVEKAKAQTQEIFDAAWAKWEAKSKKIQGGTSTIDQRIASGDLVEIAPKHIDDATPSAGRAWLENKQGYMDTLNSLERKMLDNYGLKAVDKLDNKTLKALKRGLLAEKDKNGLTAADRITEGIAMSDRVGKHWRDFGLLPYGETRNYDIMASYVYPYQFWYSRSYKNWGTRLTTDPQVIANYARLKDTMAAENKDSPEWWRYNIEIPSHFLGMPNENPLSFNLEANIWPLYGLTGTDFNDPTKRADWWSATIDDMGKLGPSTWAPISWAVAAYYAAKGEEDVAARWANRIVPQTKLIRNISSYFGQPVEIDPLTHLFSGGVDPYERNRVGRILGQYAQDGQLPDGTPITEEDLIEVARTQEGPIWDMAVRDAVKLRAGGEIAASFLGVGFKARPPEDAEIDKFYQDYHRLMSLSSAKLIPPDKIRESYDVLRERYPFMDTVLLARKAGPDRERAYSYNILSRVPPGQASDLYKIVDIDPATAQKFYDNGGDLSFLSESEKMKFISGMIDLGAMLAVPELATKQEWTAARGEYQDMKKIITQEFGDDIYDKIEHLYTLSGTAKDDYREAHPELDAARQLENEYISNNPLIYEYYGGIETLQQAYNGRMYEKLDERFGDIQPIFDHYYDLQLTDSKAASKFKKSHPEMDAYNKYKAGLKQESLAALVQFGSKLPEGPELDLRPSFTPANPTQQELAGYANPQQPTPQQFARELGEPLMNIVSHYYADLVNDPSKAKLPYQADRELDYKASSLGYDSGDDLLRAILMSMSR